MPITITLPPPDAHIGPGIQMHLVSDFVGPIATDSVWRIQIAMDPEGAQPFLDFRVPTDGAKNLGHVVMVDAEPGILGRFQPISGSTVHVIAEIVEATAPIDSGAVTSTWDTTAGLGLQINLLTGTAAQGGFTDQDRLQLAASVANTQVTVPQIGAPGGSVVTAIATFFSQLPANLLNRHGPILISGQGSIARGSDPYRIDAQGIEWHWAIIPAGFGRTLGSVDELGRRIVQFRFIDQDSSGQLFQGGYVDASVEGVRYTWGIHNPVTLEWFVAPGCVVQLWFLVPLLG